MRSEVLYLKKLWKQN